MKDGNGKRDEGRGICMDGWMIYMKRADGTCCR